MPTNYKALKMPNSSKYWVANLDTGEILNDSFPDKFMAEEWIKDQHKLQDVKLFLVKIVDKNLVHDFLIRARLEIEAVNLAKVAKLDSDEEYLSINCNKISLTEHDDPSVLFYSTDEYRPAIYPEGLPYAHRP